MPFTVQSEPPVAGANSYATVEAFRSYFADRGVDTTAHDDAAVQAALVKATQFLDVRFEYVGYRYENGQDLEWPRKLAYDDRGDHVRGVPTAVVQATCEYANRALTSDLVSDPSRDASGQRVVSKSESVGPLSESVTYSQVGFEMPSYPIADRILIRRGLVKGGGLGGLKVGSIGRA